jgi:kynurenine formamidase
VDASSLLFDVIDLTQLLGSTTPVWPGAEPVTARTLAKHESDGFYERFVALPEHVGTHIDAPAHFARTGSTVEQIEARSLVAPAVMLDARSLVGDLDDFALSGDQLLELERNQGAIARGSFLLLLTGWDRHLGSSRYLGLDSPSPPRFPGFAADCAPILIERGVIGVGIDTLGVDPGRETGCPFHQQSMAAGLIHIEGLVGLDGLPTHGTLLVVGALKLDGGSGTPARVLALVPPSKSDSGASVN